MSPGVSDEIGSTTRGFIDGLKQQPLVLAMAFMNFGLLAALFYVAWASHSSRVMQYDAEKELRVLLANCVVPSK